MGEWRLRRGDQEFPLRDNEMLKEWAASGRVNPDDYVYNPLLEKWMYACDLAELQEHFAKAKSKAEAAHLNQVSFGLGCLGFLLLFLFPPAGIIVLLIAIVMSAVYYLKR